MIKINYIRNIKHIGTLTDFFNLRELFIIGFYEKQRLVSMKPEDVFSEIVFSINPSINISNFYINNGNDQFINDVFIVERKHGESIYIGILI
jgi:hypothetical protein